MKKWQIFFYCSIIITILYVIGSKPQTPIFHRNIPVVPQQSNELEAFIAKNESSHPIKPDNQARIIWANDSTKAKTKYSLVYLHGFSASQEEGNPLHRNVAKKFGFNLYLSRLAYHGLDTIETMKYFTNQSLWNSALEAYAIGKTIGDTVILMGTSTGGTLNLILASIFPEIKALINLSPNISLNNPTAWILNNHWGLDVARLVMKGENFVAIGESEPFKKYWYTTYRLEALTELQELLEQKMNQQTYELVKQPVLNLYYYKNETNQDKIVKVDAILKMHQYLATRPELKVEKSIPTAGDHVLGSPIKSKDVKSVENAVLTFITDILKINPL